MSRWLRRLRELSEEGEAGLWSWSGCVPVLAFVLATVAIGAAVAFAIYDDTTGLMLVIVMLLAGILDLPPEKWIPRYAKAWHISTTIGVGPTGHVGDTQGHHAGHHFAQMGHKMGHQSARMGHHFAEMGHEMGHTTKWDR